MVRHDQADVAATATLVILFVAASLADAPTAVMAVLGIGLLAAPGYLWGEVLVGPGVRGLERVAVAAGLALAGLALGGLVLQLGGFWLHRATWVGLLATLTLVGDAVLLARRRSGGAGRARRAAAAGRAGQAGVAASLWQALRGHRRPIWPVAAFVAAVLIAAGGVGLARWGAAVQHYPGFTQLWLTPPGKHASAVELVVSNHQGSAMRYWLVVDRDGRTAVAWSLTLAKGQTWRRQVPFTGHAVIAASLYRLPDLSHPYRHVFASVSTRVRP